MLCISIRTRKNELPSTDLMLDLERTLARRLEKAGFMTRVEAKTRSCLKIGLHRASFRINKAKLGSNARVQYQYGRSKKGYVRTDVPTWEQRVEFNDIVNDVFDRFKLSARIKSGIFSIRDRKTGRFGEDMWKDQGSMTHSSRTGRYGASVNGFGDVIAEVMNEQDAIEMLAPSRVAA